uniref:Uncharacterized protein n=1 Tax=Romanomermis culicivorax TaxID=13658 RepID=A0A915HSW4_ROMCU
MECADEFPHTCSMYSSAPLDMNITNQSLHLASLAAERTAIPVDMENIILPSINLVNLLQQQRTLT